MWSNRRLIVFATRRALKLKSFVLFTLLVSGGVNADDGFSGEVTVGFLNTTGNTSTRSLNGKAELGYQQGAWTHIAKLATHSAQRDNITTDEHYSAGYKASLDITPLDFAFASIDYDNDRFAGITERMTEAVGYGRHLLKLPRHTLDAGLGGGATQQKQAMVEMRETDVVGLFDLKYEWLLTETSKFRQTVKVEVSKNNTYLNPVSELKLVIVGNLFTTLGYEIRSNSQVPVGTRKTDTLTFVNLGCVFGKKPA